MDDIGRKEILQYFNHVVKDSPDMSVAVAAIKTLLHFIENNKFETLAEMIAKMKDAIHCLTKTDSSVTSVSSGCELFLRFITLTNPEDADFEECQKVFVHRGNLFLQRVASSRQKVAKQADKFVRDGSKILIHSYSRVVQSVLLEASKSKKRFEIYVTESRPDESGYQTQEELSKYGIPCTVILDSAVGYIMEKIDMVLCGAEGVVENGGIINKIGTFSIAIAAKAMNKPFYVVAESFKFVRVFPLNQKDVPNEFKYKASTLRSDTDLLKEHPVVDFTPPNYITLLFTDLGVLTPSAISDELIKLYC